MLEVGTEVDRYIIEKELGRGGFARVFKVRHAVLGSFHALKVLSPELMENKEFRQRFLAEGQIQARLRHPNIVPVTDVVAVPGVAGLVMDLVEGETLEDVLRKRPLPMEPALIRDIFVQVLDGVGFAHEHGVIHRDLKPANVFLGQFAGKVVAKVIDFGIAKVDQGSGTRTGAVMGTPYYMSPEQVNGGHSMTARSDIFSIGVTLYESATGVPPFKGNTDYAIMDAIVRGEYKPPEELYPAIDPQLRAVITKAMAKLPDDRYATCAEFAAALREPAAPMKLITQVNPPPPLSTSIAPPQQGKARGPSPLLFLLLIPVLLAVAGFGILSFGASRGLWSLPWGPAGEPDAGSGSSAAVTLPVVPALPIVAAGEDAATPLAAASAGADAATAGADAETAGPDAGPPDVGAAPIDAGPRPAACVPSVSDLATNLRNGLVSGGPKAVAALEAALGGDTLFTFEDGLAPSPGTLAADEITSGDLDGDGTPEQLLTVLFSTPVAGGFVRQATLLAVFQKQPRGYCLVRRFSESVRHCPSSFERALRHDFMIQGGGLLIYRQKSSSCAPPAISVEQTIYPLKGGVLMDGPVSPVELQ